MVKRAFDILVSLVALALLALPLLLIALWIRFDSPGPALFRQERVGRHGRPFRIHKFRTMHEAHGAAPVASSLSLTPHGDPRVTRVGRWLRDRRFDELPQLIDVLYGHMSLVGPRPELAEFVNHYPPELRQQILSVRPGITDPASLAFRDEGRVLAASSDPRRTYLEELMPAKIRLQADYARSAGFTSDLRVLWRSMGVLLGRQP